MKHVNEDTLIRYLRLPSSLGAADVRRIESHVTSCVLCRRILEFLGAYYAELDQRPYNRTSKASEFLDSLLPKANVFPLHPLAYTPDSRSLGSPGITVLAADSSTAHRITARALHSEEEDVVARILHDNERDVYNVYLITPDMRKRQHVLIDFPALSLECITDERGVVEFKRPEKMESLDLDSLQAVLHIPVYSVDVSGNELLGGKDVVLKTEAGYTLTLRLHDTKLHVNAESYAKARFTRALISAGKKSKLLSLQNGIGSCNLGDMPSDLSIRLYC